MSTQKILTIKQLTKHLTKILFVFVFLMLGSIAVAKLNSVYAVYSINSVTPTCVGTTSSVSVNYSVDGPNGAAGTTDNPYNQYSTMYDFSQFLSGTYSSTWNKGGLGFSAGVSYTILLQDRNLGWPSMNKASQVFTALNCQTPPTITSPTKTSITTTGATLGGNVTSAGNGTWSSRGVCVGLSANPTTGCTSTSGTTGVFTVAVSGLSSNTLYHYRAYAASSAGTVYTTDDTFTTLNPNTQPTVVSGPTLSYQNSRFRTGPNTTWSLTLRADDAEQTGANALSWQLRTASGGGGTLITSGTTTSGQTNNFGSFAYTQTGVVEGSNTVYLRIYDGTAWSNDWFSWLYRDTVNPTSATSISHSPANVSTDNNYTVTFTPNDAASTNSNELIGYVYTGPNGTGTYLTGTSATSGQSKTTSTITDTALVQGNNTRYLRTCDGANNCSDTSFTVIKSSTASISSPTKNSITVYGANLGGNITTDNGNTITGRGVCVGASADPAIGGNCIGTTGTTGIFSVLFTNLTGATTYHYRAYATNSAGTVYTTDDTFITITPATGCTFPISGDVSINSTCNIPTNGLTVSTTQLRLVGSDTGSIQMLADMTVNPGSILVWGPGKQIVRAPGVTMFNATGTQITQKYICLYDPDSDGVPNDYIVNTQGGTAVLQDSSSCGTNYIRPNSLNAAFLEFNSAVKDLAPDDGLCFDSATCN